MLTALLAALVIASLSWGKISFPGPLWMGLALALVLVLGRHPHSHGTMRMMDVLAGCSRLASVNPALKAGGCGGLLLFCLLARTSWLPLALFLGMAAATCAAGVKLRLYWSALTVPAAFLCASVLAMLWQYASAPGGLASIPFFSGYLVLFPAAQAKACLVFFRALGAVSCLYFLSFTTPMPELLGVLRRLPVPDVVMDLAILIYRYLFVLLATYENMRDAAESRLGFSAPARSLRTTGVLYGNLLARSFRRAQACFDAMESRCCDGPIRFWTRPKPVRFLHVLGFGVLWSGMVLALMCGG